MSKKSLVRFVPVLTLIYTHNSLVFFVTHSLFVTFFSTFFVCVLNFPLRLHIGTVVQLETGFKLEIPKYDLHFGGRRKWIGKNEIRFFFVVSYFFLIFFARSNANRGQK